MNGDWEYRLAVATLAVAVCGGWLDWRWRRIPNWLTLPALLFGIGVHVAAAGWPGAKDALAGAGLGLGLLLPFVLVRGLGAGDWKLMGALGALTGRERLVMVLLLSMLIAGLMAVVEMVRRRRVKQTLSNTLKLVGVAATFGRGGACKEITLDNSELMTLPFGVAAAIATLMLYSTFVRSLF